MPATLRELRERRKSVTATMKITKAMEMIAASRVNKAQLKAKQSEPFNDELVSAVGMVAGHTDVAHPLTVEAPNPKRAALLVLSSDRGLAGAYSSNVIRMAEGLIDRLTAAGREVDLYTTGRKAADYFSFRERTPVRAWAGFSEDPQFSNAKEIGELIIEQFLTDADEGGVDELHVVFTQFNSMVSQTPRIMRLLPLEVVEGEERSGPQQTYDFEPDAASVLDQLLPMYVQSRIYYGLVESAASEVAARQQAMHSATDNAKGLIEQLTREANQARQAEITQEINEIVGGAGALADSGQEN